MGQRHQIFIHTVNPYHTEYDKSKKAELKEMFGTDKTTVFAFHNQWLYGRSALLSALNVLEFNDGLTKKERLESSYIDEKNPFAHSSIKYMNFEKIEQLMGAILNLVSKDYDFRSKGWLGSWLLNKEEPHMREMFTHGDNNAGITIIDAVTNKYCFMNIYNKNEEIEHNSKHLESLIPSSGKQYVEAYNPSLVKLAKTSYHGERALEKGEQEFKEHIKQTRKVNNHLVRRLSKFEVLTEKELRIIFKKQYSKIDEKVVSAYDLLSEIKNHSK